MDYIFDPVRRLAFNAAYWAAQSPAVVAACQISDFATRSAVLEALAQAGSFVDKAIMVRGWEPYQTMLMRFCDGYGWTPNILDENNISVPGITVPGMPPYDPNKPDPNSMLVHDPNTFDLATWFPPFSTPVPPPLPDAAPVPFVDLKNPWPDQGPNAYYSTRAGFGVPEGQNRVDPDNRTYIKIVVGGAFVSYQGWRLVQ